MTREATDAVESRLQWAVQIARRAGDLTLRYFRRADLAIERKADDSPVTVADREAEVLLRRLIAERFPGDGILGEELGSANGTSGYRWVLDPIDGTKSFIHGVPLYTTLVAVMRDEQPCAGVIHAPAAAETVYAATGGGCWYLPDEGVQPQPARVSRVSTLRESLLLTSDVGAFTRERRVDAMHVLLALERAVRLARTWGDGYGYLMVATGRAEVMLDPAVKLWDVAALQPVIEEAGGDIRDWQGRRTVHAADWLATNGRVTDELLALIRE